MSVTAERSLPPRCDGIRQEIAVEILQRGSVFLPAVHRIAKECARSREFLASPCPSRIRDREVQEFKSSDKRLFAEIRVSTLPFANPPNFASDVCQLLQQRALMPCACSLFVMDCHMLSRE